MDCFRYDLKLDYEGLSLGGGHRAYMDCYLPANFQEYSEGRLRSAVVICPGGGYKMRSDREAEPIALQYVAADMAVFIVHYSVYEDAAFPRCLFEALTAIKTVRENAEEWHVNPAQIAILGFSAGGHLAASAGAFWNRDFTRKALGDTEKLRPNAAVLCYPVITSGPFAHRGSFNRLVGEDADEAALEQVSIEKQVTADYPPSFIWHTATDTTVPVQNALLMADALEAQKVPFELHIYPNGPHGLALSDERTAKRDSDGQYRTDYCAVRPRQWVADSISFLKEFLPAE